MTTITMTIDPSFGQEQELSWLETESPVAIERFGKDHWSTFAYVETRIMDHRGVLEHDNMRCSGTQHPLLVNAGSRAAAIGGADGSRYPTRLKKATRVSGIWEVEELGDHDDYDCLADAITAGLLEVHMPTVGANGNYVDVYGKAIKMDGSSIRSGLVTGLSEAHLQRYATFRLTDRGVDVASQLRAHKSDGGNYHDFVPRAS